MEHLLSLYFLILTIFTCHHIDGTLASSPPPCESRCGSLEIKYPFGTAPGCGSPRFHPYVSCTGSQLLLSTHSGSYPITSISYSTSTITLTPPSMSTCTTMHKSPNLGLDWATPFQLGPSTLILLSCSPPTASLSACDPSSDRLCAAVHTCPAVVDLGLPLFPPTNSCCVYSPANLDDKDELDLRGLNCAGYASVVSVNDYPTDPTRWEYGVAVKYTRGAFDGYDVDVRCRACESSGGACGYDTRDYSFACVCGGGFNTTMDCYGSNYNQYFLEEDDQNSSCSLSPPTYGKLWSAILVVLLCIAA